METLKSLIKDTDMTLRQFAKYFGIPIRTVENWVYRNDPPAYILELMLYKLEHENKIKKDGQP